MDWKYLFLDFEGRIGRKDFWIGSVALVFAFAAIRLLIFPLSWLAWLALSYPAFAVLIKRCHDRGKSGLWSLLAFVPFVGLIWAIIDLGILTGDPGPNAYGPSPLNAGEIAPPAPDAAAPAADQADGGD